VRVTARIIGPVLLATDRSSAYIRSALILFPRGPAFIGAGIGVVWFYKGPGIGLPEYFKSAIKSACRLALPHVRLFQGSTQSPAESRLSSSSRSGRWTVFLQGSERSRQSAAISLGQPSQRPSSLSRFQFATPNVPRLQIYSFPQRSNDFPPAEIGGVSWFPGKVSRG
jgi:hypothetical protein